MHLLIVTALLMQDLVKGAKTYGDSDAVQKLLGGGAGA